MRRVPPFCGPAAAEADAAVVGDGPVIGGAAQPARVAITKSATGSLRRAVTMSSSLRSAPCADRRRLGAQDSPARTAVSGAVQLQRGLSQPGSSGPVGDVRRWDPKRAEHLAADAADPG